MGRVARAFTSILLSAYGTHASSCLLDRQIDRTFGEQGDYLTPLSPPVIVAERRTGSVTLTNPLPSEIIVVPTDAPTPFRQTFRVAVRYEFPVRLFVRGFVNRNLDTCLQSNDPRSSTCGVEIPRTDLTPVLDPPDGGTLRTLSFARDFAPSTCTRVDLYISPRFQDLDATVRHLPDRPGEVAHARWYVVVPSTLGVYPPLDACQDASMSL
jgi:hypothetical protein